MQISITLFSFTNMNTTNSQVQGEENAVALDGVQQSGEDRKDKKDSDHDDGHNGGGHNGDDW